MFAFCHTPLCPAGHLPLKGGDYSRRRHRVISPLEGEMGGSPKGGAAERGISARLRT